MDLSKAFDHIYHPLLIAKLLASYLTGRSQEVRILSAFSEWKPVPKGVPQGSVFGPCLFNFFINDLFLFMNRATLSNFADDNTLTAIADSIKEVGDLLSAESSIAINWFANNFMEANSTKFQAMLLGKQDVENFHIDIHGTRIQNTESVKLLGVTIDAKLNFDQHVSELCKKKPQPSWAF